VSGAREPAPRRRIVYALCYRDPDYLRTLTLTAAFRAIDGVDLVVVKNRKLGLMRYPEVVVKLWRERLRRRPDAFVVGFRGHEAFAFLYPSMAGRPIVFDEFVNLRGWLVEERHRLREGSRALRAIDAYMRWVLRRSTVVLADTDAQADYSARVYGTPREKFAVVPVGADEATFHPRPAPPRGDERFEVLFYGSMLPLHGLDVLLAAIPRTADDVRFSLIGGRTDAAETIASFVRSHELEDRVRHEKWVPYVELPDRIAAADLVIGGPLGDTGQARRVVTGKTYQCLAAAKAVIVGEVDTPTELEDRVDCLVVPQGSPDALAEAIAWAAAHRAETAEIGLRGRRTFERSFSTARIAADLEAVLERLARHG
jgi:glycosyltransferase involved in cell wall biosynthesis